MYIYIYIYIYIASLHRHHGVHGVHDGLRVPRVDLQGIALYHYRIIITIVTIIVFISSSSSSSSSS